MGIPQSIAGIAFSTFIFTLFPSPAEALTYILSGNYTFTGGGTGSVGGSFSWDGTTLSDATITLNGTVPSTTGEESTNWTTTQALAFTNTSPFSLTWNGANGVQGNGADSLRINFSSALPAVPSIGNIANISSLTYCGRISGSNNAATFTSATGNCDADTFNSSTSSVIATAVPSPMSSLGVLAVSPLVFGRKKLLALLRS